LREPLCPSLLVLSQPRRENRCKAAYYCSRECSILLLALGALQHVSVTNGAYTDHVRQAGARIRLLACSCFAT
jgi:hypothetical protein